MFSERVPPGLEPNRITQAVRRARAAARPLLDLTITNPTTAGFGTSLDARAALTSPDALRYDPQPFGLPEARRAVACDYARRGIEVNPERIVLTASTSEAYSLLFKLLCRPDGDAVMVPGSELSAVRASDGARRRSVDPVSARLSRSMGAGDGRPGALLDLRGACRAGGQPEQPDRLGAVARGASRRSRRSAPSAARRSSSTRCLRTTPLDVAGSGQRPRSVGTQSAPLTFRLGGLSKSAGLPQVKLGWILIDGPDALVREAMERLEVICDAYLSVSTPVQVAAPGLIAAGAGDSRADSRSRPVELSRARSRRPRVIRRSRSLPTEAGWSSVLRVPSTRSEEDLVVDLLDRDDVLVHPGFFFDFSSRSLSRRQPAPRAGGVCRGHAARAGAGRCVSVAPGGSTAAGTPACWFPCSRFRRGGAGGLARSLTSFPLSRWLEQAGLDFVQFLPLNEMQEGQSSPYSALSAMAIDPCYIALDGRRRIRGGGRRRAGRQRNARRSRARAWPLAWTTPPCAPSRDARCGARSAWFADHSWGTGDRRDRSLRAFEERERWWLGRLRAFPRAARRPRRAALARVGARAEGPRSVGPRRGARAARVADSLLRLPAVDCRRAVAAREDGSGAGRRVRRLSVHGQRTQRRRLGEAARVRPRQLRRHPARRVLGDGAGLGAAGVPLGRCRGRRLRVAAGARPAIGGSLRRLPHRSPHRFLSNIRAQAGRRRRVRPGRRSRAAGPGRAAARRVQRERREPDRRGSRNRARLPARVARRAGHSGDEGHALGARLARRRSAVPRRDRVSAEASVATSGTHDTETLAEWWDNADVHERQAVLAAPAVA